jgi:SNF2 family DNA or RNA helicase
MLIADDVGLGKTIEAGYILKELQARQPIERVLIIVPARLKLKWKTELEKRFDEVFETVGRAEIRERFLDPLTRGREAPTFRWIASYESVRAPDIEQAFRELQPTLDLVVLDEAHRVRNSETKQHQLAKALGGCADAFLFLTATPIQTGRENLFSLLNLLDPDEFARRDVFEEQLEANRPVVRALRALRSSPPNLDAVRTEIYKLRDNPLTRSMTTGPFFRIVTERLEAGELDRAGLVELQRDISAMGLLSQILSRTRKLEVLPDRPTRHPQSVEVDLTPEERKVYESAALLAMVLKPGGGGWGASMAALMALRMTASCIPAAITYFRQRAGSTIDEFVRKASVLMDEEEEAEESGPLASDTRTGFWESLKDVLESRKSGPTIELAAPGSARSSSSPSSAAHSSTWHASLATAVSNTG